MTELYLITPPRLGPDFADALAAALDAGPVACIQLRLKEAGADEMRRAIDALRPVAQSRGVAFLLNDDPRLAVETGCDGAHLGQDDLAAHGGLARVRRVLDGLSLGITCHDSRHLAMEAAEQGADYVAFGAFYPTGTKEPKARADVEILRWWSELMEVPCVAIGGITPGNAAPLVEAGADFLAVVGAVWQHPDGPAAGVRAFRAELA
ncbi:MULTISPECIES: thiamine phosphate synthase [Acidiphilium]|uniref:Thiamine-phosphate synthase n=1 Tax=Acidiphilium multivorum (strain DSM 11245 / JCM 8867 / NBRC 100883 / AIU 301) TaxID=926570 RepID=F0J3G3_ACIMA|nr:MULTISPECIES: thiamine phosphate synthase [Acidiphilium]KDM67448.1 thiamine-phosphate synthase ThiE [Acidiphilium sp. JA12-A1]MBS3024992.1 thiamine phosphate synthase [Acidiphilium multivorum]BAJ79819.1 thiamine-phosphate pyrophosphorylase [Acidiphilium multivorum AIU301]GAN73027.1 thiamine phosphate pyrophosphorylase [Acidiphilium multivorum AIU301]